MGLWQQRMFYQELEEMTDRIYIIKEEQVII